MNVESLDAMTDFLIALDKLGPHMEAVGRLTCAAVEMRRWGVSMDLHIYSLTREEFDSFEGEEKMLFRGEDKAKTPFWSKSVEYYHGGYTSEAGVEGRVMLTLFTDFGPVPENPNEGIDAPYPEGGPCGDQYVGFQRV